MSCDFLEVLIECDRPWFSATMSTGALAVVLGNTPNTFPGLMTIGKIVYILDVIMFVVFTAMMITRFCLVPRKLTASLHHPVEGLFHGTYWVSASLILNGAYVYGHSETGSWLTTALRICFWIYCAAAFTISIAQYSMFFRLERLNVTDAVPAWIFPIYPLLVVGTLAGTILPSQPQKAAWEIFVGGVLFQGIAWLVSFLMYAIYMQRLMTSHLPSATVRPGMYVSVGPAGTISLATTFTSGTNVIQAIRQQVYSLWRQEHRTSFLRTSLPTLWFLTARSSASSASWLDFSLPSSPTGFSSSPP